MGVISQIRQYFGGKTPQIPATDTEQRSTLSSPSDWFLEWINGGRKVAGQTVTPETALKISAVYACVSLLSRTVASLQVGYYRSTTGNQVEKISGTPEGYAVTVEPHDYYDSYQWRATAMLHLALRGNHYSRLHFDRLGRVDRFDILHPDMVVPFKLKGKLYYRNNTDGANEVLFPSEVLHLKLFSDDGICGKSPLTYARETIGMALAANDYASAMYENGGGLRGIVTGIPMGYRPEQLDQLRNEFVKVMRDYKTTGSIGSLRGDMKFEQIALSPQDAQFIETSKMGVEDIARFFGVPLHLIGNLDRATNNNIEHQSIEFVTHTVRPLVKIWEAELHRKVIRKSEREVNFFRFNLDSLLRGDTNARANFYKTMLNIGAMNPDEIRAMENMNAIPGGYGEKYYIQMNMTTLDRINEADPNGEPQTDNSNEQQTNN